jgi:flagellar assembly factor FliW
MTAQVNKTTEQTLITYPLIIESRFGDITIHESDGVTLPRGIYGFEEYTTYAVIDLPGQTITNFRILQCLDEVALVFMLTPLLHMGGLLIPKADLCEATDHLSLDFDNCDFYAITTVCEKDNGLEISLNLKAPIVVDRQHKKAWQYILECSDYPVKYVLKTNT